MKRFLQLLILTGLLFGQDVLNNKSSNIYKGNFIDIVEGNRDSKLKNYIERGLGRAENNTYWSSYSADGSRDASLTVILIAPYGDDWNGNELCIRNLYSCLTLDSDSIETFDIGVLASGDHAVT